MADHLPAHVATALQERARALAQPVQAAERDRGTQMVDLAVGSERYLVEIRHVREVQPAAPPTPVPGVPEFWAGVVNVRGTLYPVLDLARYMEVISGGGNGMLALVSAAGLDVALLVDEVSEAREIHPSDIRGPLGARSPKTRAIRGTTADLLSVLDLDALLSDPQLTLDRQTV